MLNYSFAIDKNVYFVRVRVRANDEMSNEKQTLNESSERTHWEYEERKLIKSAKVIGSLAFVLCVEKFAKVYRMNPEKYFSLSVFFLSDQIQSKNSTN